MKKNFKNGFTYMELVMVLTLVSLLVGITLVWVANQIQLKNYVQRLMSDIRYAQFYAISQNMPIRLNFFTHAYSLTKLDGVTPVNFPSRNDSVMQLGDSVFLSDVGLPAHYVIFDGRGAPYINSNPWTPLVSDATVSLTTEQETNTIYITPETGKVRT